MKKTNCIKKIFIALVALLITIQLYSQIPQKMSYQAVVRDAENQIIANTNIGAKITILQGSETGDPVYVETHNMMTNDNGLISLTIGEGTSSKNFSDIDWSAGSFYIKTEVDPAGGTSYSISGTSKILSVPYAFHSKTSGDIPKGFNIGDMMYWTETGWSVIPVGKNGHALILCDGVPTWGGCDDDDDLPIFVVENRHGVNVIEVFSNDVLINLYDDSDDKSARGSFAVGGFTTNKEPINFLKVTPDSVRVYIEERDDTKSARGSFAVGGFTTNKDDGVHNYFEVTSDTTYITTTVLISEDLQVGGNLNLGGGLFNKPKVNTYDAQIIEDILRLTGDAADETGGEITELGFYYGLTSSPCTDGELLPGIITNKTTNLISFFVEINIEDLDPETKYYFVAYAINEAGKNFGEVKSFYTNQEIADINGNEYKVIAIGTQIWMAENLRSTSYSNGDDITTSLNNESWESATSGAFEVYPIDGIDDIPSQQEMAELYGVLYNWHAVADSRGICPSGWKVPSVSDWHNLIISAGGSTNAGKALKIMNTSPSDPHPRWDAPNNATDAFGFAAVPAGYRDNAGVYYGFGSNLNLWTTDEGSIGAFLFNIVNEFDDIQQSDQNKKSGFSVRCIKE